MEVKITLIACHILWPILSCLILWNFQ